MRSARFSSDSFTAGKLSHDLGLGHLGFQAAAAHPRQLQVRERLMEPVVEAFLANGAKYNLLNSAVLELMDFIRKACHA